MRAPRHHRFERRFERAADALLPAGSNLLVAVSGGVDSVVLLYELRQLAPRRRWSVTAAHLDHAMRRDSASDAAWVKGLCQAWEVPLVAGRLDDAPRGETDARTARHTFLRRSARSAGCEMIATAHHADDQAETVLFRAVRGTGVRGLAGMRPETPDGIVRPLLDFPRTVIRRRARALGLRYREDPTNATLRPVRNRIRHGVLPRLERHVHPAARRNLARLAAEAAEHTRAMDDLLRPFVEESVRREEADILVDRQRLRGYPPARASLVLRAALAMAGHRPDRAGTEAAMAFITNAPSGRRLELGGGVELWAEFDTARVHRPRVAEPDRPVEIMPPGDAEAPERTARFGGRRLVVRWWRERGDGSSGEDVNRIDLAAVRAPLLLRAWRPGDRIRTAAGTKKLKKVFGERRVPRSERGRLPVLVDATGEVVLVPGLVRAVRVVPRMDADALVISIQDA